MSGKIASRICRIMSLVLLWLLTTPVRIYADNCGSPMDCYGTIAAAAAVIAAIAVAIIVLAIVLPELLAAGEIIEIGELTEIEQLANLSSKEINQQIIGAAQRELLKDFFGEGLEGAASRSANFEIPEGLTRQALEGYREIARRAIEEGIDKLGVQAARIRLIDRALQLLSGG